jgi:hypothetical protein
LEFSYEELLDVTEEQLEKKGVTLGARGKIFKNISLIKERPQRIQKLSDMLEVSSEVFSKAVVLNKSTFVLWVPTFRSPKPA